MKKILMIMATLVCGLGFSAMALDDDGQVECGFRGMIDFSALYGGRDYWGDFGYNYQVQGAFTGGYQINKMIFVGGGMAPTLNLLDDKYYDEVDASFLLPIYTAARFDFLDKKFTPFAEARIGYYVDTENTDASDLYLYTGAGVRLGRISLSAGYTYYGNGDWDPAHFVGLKFGFEF